MMIFNKYIKTKLSSGLLLVFVFYLMPTTKLIGIDSESVSNNHFFQDKDKSSFNEDKLKKDLDLIGNFDDVEDGIILFSLFRIYFLRTFSEKATDRKKIEKYFDVKLKELQKKIYNEHARRFKEEMASKPTKKQEQDITSQSREHFNNLINMNPGEKLKRIASMELRYIKTAKSDDSEKSKKKRERRRIVIEIALNEAQMEFDKLSRKQYSEKTFWQRHKKYMLPAFALATGLLIYKGIPVAKKKLGGLFEKPEKVDVSYKLWNILYGFDNKKDKLFSSFVINYSKIKGAENELSLKKDEEKRAPSNKKPAIRKVIQDIEKKIKEINKKIDTIIAVASDPSSENYLTDPVVQDIKNKVLELIKVDIGKKEKVKNGDDNK